MDIGCETRTVVSDCRFVMDVEDAVGKKVLIVVNVPLVEIHGIGSHGKIHGSHSSVNILQEKGNCTIIF